MRSGLNEKGQPTRACLQCLELPSPRPPNRLATTSHLTPPCFLTDSSTMTQRDGLSLAYPIAFTNFLQLRSFRPPTINAVKPEIRLPGARSSKSRNLTPKETQAIAG